MSPNSPDQTTAPAARGAASLPAGDGPAAARSSSARRKRATASGN
jgi:hypothetical protein